ncbi:modular serine protease-like [Aphis craccivora]|uniref:Modular serine protease-like n=1 Tax=Aphis craccivora TaxID=307492 RepID=A0A6G0XZ90_APHCR|nr:modular serine protease-like [Aphis craccivora]
MKRQGVNEGDSGAGLTFLHSDLYYLTGVVSIKDAIANNSIAVFTGLKQHIPWIRELYNKYTSYASDIQLGKRNLKKSNHVQPTAISRRKERSGLTRGSRRIQAGRPSAIEVKAKAKAKKN